jgi:hypothetical protein
VDFDEAAKLLTVLIDFKPGRRFAVSGHEGVYPVRSTVTKSYRHMNVGADANLSHRADPILRLKRIDSLPVSTMWQWCVSRSSSAPMQTEVEHWK